MKLSTTIVNPNGEDLPVVDGSAARRPIRPVLRLVPQPLTIAKLDRDSIRPSIQTKRPTARCAGQCDRREIVVAVVITRSLPALAINPPRDSLPNRSGRAGSFWSKRVP